MSGLRVFRREIRVRTIWLVAVLVVSLVGSALMFVPPLLRSPDALTGALTRAVEGVAPVGIRSQEPVRNDADRPYSPPNVMWPAETRGKLAASSHEPVHLSGSPVWVQTTKPGERAEAELAVAGRENAARLGIDGVVITVATQSTPADARIGLDYAGFDAAYGGAYGSRLGLVSLPECALTTPELTECRNRTPIAYDNDTRSRSVSTVAPANTRMVLAATSGTSSSSGAGSFSATSLEAAGSWAGGLQSGSFTYGYPIKVPPAASGLVPDFGLSYDSGSVDGKTAATQSQSSWVGDGWGTPRSFIEQSFVPCANSPGGSPSPVVTQNSCYAGEILTMSLNGSSAILVWDVGQGTYRPSNDDGSVVTKVVNSNNGTGTYNTSYWTVTDRNGTKFHFGRNQLPGWSAGSQPTNSVDSVPVFSAHSGDPCYNPAGFTSSVCTMAYRWNLDYITDIRGNAMSYYYKQDTNFYGKNKGAENVSYVRDSYLDHIDYGFVDGTAYSSPAPNQLRFTTGERCVTGTCTPLNDSTKANWPDVPYDLNCASGTVCASHSPSFWSTVRLASIATHQWSATANQYVPVDSWQLNQTIPGTGDTSPSTLWLAGITRTGHDTTAGGSSAPITLPSITFSGQAMPNRVDTLNDGLIPFTRHRITSISTETGATIGVTYTPISDCVGPVTVEPSNNTNRCYPVKWTPPDAYQPFDDWFHKYAVETVTQNDNTLDTQIVRTSYAYQGAAWHYDDNELVEAKNRTWGQWRGYATVQTRTGQHDVSQTLSETKYYQGMHADILPNDATRSVTLTDSQGGAHVDTDQFAGRVLESTTYRGDGGPVESSTVNSYWLSAPTASRTRTGLPALTAHYSGQIESWARQAVTSSGTTTWRITETDTAYDPATGLPTLVYSHGDVSQPSQATCTSISYAPFNTATNLVGLVSEIDVVAKPCGGASPSGVSAPTSTQINALAPPTGVNRPADVVSNARTFYDNPTLAQTWPQPADPAWPQATPTTGAVSVMRSASGYNSGYTYQTTSATEYDSYGRVIAAYDGRGNKIATAHTMSGGLTTEVAVSNALGHSASTTLNPMRGMSTLVRDLNGISTTSHYDALGRITSVWAANRVTSTPASATFAYSLSKTEPPSVTSNVLNGAQAYITTYAIYDALLRERQTQAPTPQGGRLLTNKFYDSHGWLVKENHPYWDSSLPNATLVRAPDNQILNQSRYTHDGLGRVVVADSNRAAVTISSATTVYSGDRTTVIPPTGGVVTTAVKDALDRPTSLIQYSQRPTLGAPNDSFTGTYSLTGGTAQATTFTYDNRGRPHQRIDPAGNTWTSTHNLVGQLTNSSDPDSGTSATTYDLAGNITSATNAKGQTLSYGYDALNRKTSQYDGPTAASPQLASWTYDGQGASPALTNAVGKLTAKTAYKPDAGTSHAYTTKTTSGFNAFGSPLETTVVVPSNEGALAGTYKFIHQYNAHTNLPTRDVYPAAGGLPTELVGYQYATALDLLAGVAGGANGFTGGMTFDAHSRPILQRFNYSPNLAYRTMTYDDHTGRRTGVTIDRSAAPTRLEDITYQYDLAGNLVRETNTRNNTAIETQCYRYDGLLRLSSAWTATDACAADPASNSAATVGSGIGAASAYWTSWSFDALGDRTSQTQHGLGGVADTVTTYAHPASGPGSVRPHSLTSTSTTGPAGNSSTSYVYDAAGNMSSRTLPTGQQGLTWTTRGELNTVTAPESTTSYLYDADGTQLIRRDPGVTTLFLPNQELVLNTSTNVVTGSRFYPLPGGGQAIRTGTGTNYRYELGDAHGTGTMSLDNTAQVPTWRQSTPYGEERGEVPSVWPTTHGFLNKPHSKTTGLTDVGARKYDPSIGRFISVDPILDLSAPQSWTGYAYANNNPITYSDPTGLIADYDNIGNEQTTWGLVNPEAKKIADDAQAKQQSDLVSGKNTDRSKQPEVGGVILPTFETLRKGIYGAGYQDHEYGLALHDWAYRMCFGGNTRGPEQFCSEAQRLGLLDFDKTAILEYLPGVDLYRCVATGSTESCVWAGIDLIPFGKLGKLAGKGAKAALDAASSPYSKSLAQVFCKSPNSFVPGTLVLMADGTTKPIEDIDVGDHVYASDPTTGEHGAHEVTHTITGTGDKHLITLTIDTDGPRGDATATITATDKHPFWTTTHQQWADAANLKPGHNLATPTGARVAVLDTTSTERVLTVHNLTIHGLHTYYVLAGATPVLVHNDSSCINWASNSVKTWGHAFKTHGAGAKNTRSLTDRARSTGNDQGQWLDNDAAADYLRGVHSPNAGPFSVRLPAGLGQVIRPDGTIVQAPYALIVPGPNGLVKTAYPYLGAP